MPNYFKYFLMLLALPFALPVAAQYQQWPTANDVEITIIDDRGRGFPQYPLRRGTKPDTYRAYLAADEGKNYSIRVRNRGDQRIGVVIAVDGRNIISGDKSWLRPQERMYVLNPYQQATYEGWRTGKNWVNRFYFTTPEDSYAEAWDDSTAMGVIAVAVFREKPQYRPWPRNNNELSRPQSRSRAQQAPNIASEEAGTGFGDKDWSPVRKVSFEPERSAMTRYFIKYEWHGTLCRKNIIRCDDHSPRRPRNRFWDDRDNPGYAPYPPGYRN